MTTQELKKELSKIIESLTEERWEEIIESHLNQHTKLGKDLEDIEHWLVLDSWAELEGYDSRYFITGENGMREYTVWDLLEFL